MSKIVCRECDSIFDEPKMIQDYRGEFWGMPSYETLYVCPYCGSEDIYEDSSDDEE